MQFNCITGLPRSGSTLLCNILNQNPMFHATSTDPLCAGLVALKNTWSNSIEMKNLLNLYPDETTETIKMCYRALVLNHHRKHNDKIVFNKSRGWSHLHTMLKSFTHETKLLVTVRDLREIFASCQKQEYKTGILSNGADNELASSNDKFGENGMISMPLKGVEDLIRKNPDNVMFVEYHKLAKNPARMMRDIYSFLDLEPFEHDLDNVKNEAIDPDGFYLNKFPHKGEGKVELKGTSNWTNFVSGGTAQRIYSISQLYNNRFGF